MEAAALSILLSAGFVFLRLWHVARILSIKEGQVIYLASVIAAVPLAVIASSLLRIGEDVMRLIDANWLSPFMAAFGSRPADGGRLMAVALLALLLAPALGWLASVPFRRNPTLSRASLDFIGEPHPLDSVLTEATDRELPVLVTLLSGKVYLGFSLQGQPYAQSGSQWLLIAPWLSGYRDAELKLQFTTNYSGLAWTTDDDGQPRHNPAFQLSLPLAAVQSVAPFDMATYESVFARETGPEAPGGTNADDVPEVVEDLAIPERQAASLHARQRDWRLYWLGFTATAFSACIVGSASLASLLMGVLGVLVLAGVSFRGNAEPHREA
jgi:hypothetical protein